MRLFSIASLSLRSLWLRRADPDLAGLYFAQRDWIRAAYASWEHGNILPQFV
jgi:hypothetical protein